MTAEKKKRKAGKKDGDNEGLATVEEVTDGDEFAEIRDQVKALKDKADESYWDLAIILHKIYQEALYRKWGYGKWPEYIEEELDFSLRKAQQLVQLQEWFTKIPKNIQNWIKKLGYAKARRLVDRVTVENAAEWRNKVEGKTLAEINEIIKGASEDASLTTGEGGGDANTSEKFKSMNFKLAPPQFENVDRALTKAKEMAESEKPGNALDLMATEFLSTHAGIDTIQEYLRSVEKNAGVRLVAYDEKEDSVIFGGDLINDLEGKDDEEEEETEE